MPTYDYRCDKCGHEFETMLPLARRKEPVETPCAQESPVCGGEVKQIIVSASGLADPIRLGLRKPDDGFKDMMRRMKRNVPGAQDMDLNF